MRGRAAAVAQPCGRASSRKGELMLDVLGTATRGRWTKRALDRRVRVLGANAPAPTASKQMERRIITQFYLLAGQSSNVWR